MKESIYVTALGREITFYSTLSYHGIHVNIIDDLFFNEEKEAFEIEIRTKRDVVSTNYHYPKSSLEAAINLLTDVDNSITIILNSGSASIKDVSASNRLYTVLTALKEITL